MTSFDFYVVIE